MIDWAFLKMIVGFVGILATLICLVIVVFDIGKPMYPDDSDEEGGA